MNTAFKSETASGIGTSPTTIYTVPASTTSLVIGFTISNITANIVYANISIAGISYGKNLPIPSGSTLSALDGKLVMQTTETVVITMDVASAADVYFSVMEMT